MAEEHYIKTRVHIRKTFLTITGYQQIFKMVPRSKQFLGIDDTNAYLTIYRPDRLQNIYDISQAMPKIVWLTQTGKIKHENFKNGWFLPRRIFGRGEDIDPVEVMGCFTYFIGADNLTDIYYVAIMPQVVRDILVERLKHV